MTIGQMHHWEPDLMVAQTSALPGCGLLIFQPKRQGHRDLQDLLPRDDGRRLVKLVEKSAMGAVLLF